MLKFLRIFVALISLFFIGNAMAAGYTCPASAKKYTSCKAGYYLNGTGAGNKCSTCSSLGYTSSANGNSNGAAACYKPCTKACTKQTCPSSAHSCTHGSTSTSGTQYYGGSCSAKASTCSLTINSCAAGYYKSGNSCPACSSLGDGTYTSSADGNTTGTGACYKSCTKACTQQTCPSSAYSCTHGSTSTSGTHYYGGSCSAKASTCSLTINSCKAGYYKSGNSCVACPSGYTSANGTTGGSSSCYISCAAGTYVKTAGGKCESVGTGYYKAAHTVNYGSTSTRTQCPENYRSGAAAGAQSGCKTSCAAGTYVAKANAACTSVGTGYYKAAHTVNYGSTSTRTQCPENYRSGAAAGAQSGCKTSCAAGTYVAKANAACTSVGTGYYKAAHTVNYGSTSTRNQCPSGYRDGAAASAQSGCKMSVDAGKYVATANASSASTCAAGTYKAAHTVSYGSTSSCSACSGRTKYSKSGAASCRTVDSGYYTTGCNSSGNNCTGQSQCTSGTYCTSGVQRNCSALSGVSVSGGTYSSAVGSTASTACKYKAPAPSVPTYCATKTSNTVTYTGSAWPTSTYAVTAKSGAIISGNNTASATCTQCAAGTFSAGGTATSCSACRGRTKYSKSGAASCSTVNSGYYTTGCNSSGNNCTGQSACGGNNYYCSSGVRNTVSSGYYSTGGTSTTRTGQSQCTGATYCSGGVQSTCPSGYDDNTTAGKTAASQCQISVAGGKYVGTKNSATLSSCAAGYYKAAHTVNYGSTSSCSACSGTTYSDTTGASSCKSCPTTSYDASLRDSYSYYTNDGVHDTISGCRASWTKTGTRGKYSYSCSYDSATGDYGSGNKSAHCMIDVLSCKATYYTSIEVGAQGYPRTWVNSRSEFDVCTSAGTGYYSADGDLDRTQCPANYRSGAAASAQSGCKASCAAGTYVAKANAACTSVGTGYYKAAHTVSYGSTSTRTQCPENYRSGAAASAQSGCKTSCAAGTYVAKANAACTSVGTGYYKAAHTVSYGSTSTRTQCPENYRSGAAAGAQSGCKASCAAGTYVAKANAACTSVGTGYYKAAHTVNYGSTSTRNECPSGYPNSDSGAGTITRCYSNNKSRAWTGSQTACAKPTGCATVSCKSCSGSACTYVAYSNSAGTGDGTIKSGCSTNNEPCQQTVASVTASANRYVSGTTCPACSSYSSTHTLSDGGNISSAYCYRNATKTGSQVNGSVPSGCASVTSWNACTPGTCTYKDYYSATDTTCTPTNCTKTPAAVTAKANYYVSSSGTTCSACSSYSSTHTLSDGGNISSAYCYRNATKTGSQVNGSVPSGCASVTSWNACTPGTCTYKDYYSATDTTCTPTNCTKTVAAVAAKSGYYDGGTTCPACPTAYPNSAANNEGGIAKCYMSVSGGKYVAKANATSVSTCAAGTYKAAHSVYYGSTSSCSVCGNNSYSNAGAASCTACATDYSNSGTAAASHAGASSCKISCDAGTRVASANAGCTTPSGNWYVGAHTVSQGSISSVNSCLTNYVITGTSPSNHDASSDCKITCAGGSYIAAANNTSCTKVGAGYWAAASVVPQGSKGVRNACESGMTTIGFGAGADESGDCGRVLNIGNEKIYLRSTKKTSPSLNISINGDVFYGSMSTANAHAGSSLKINSGGTIYSVYDDSNPPLEHTGGNAND